MSNTPGTWTYEYGSVYADRGRVLLADRENRETIPMERDANCRLAAAAPDLLKALEAALNHLDYCGYGDSWERECALNRDWPLDQQIEAAIAKAKGVTP